MSTVLVTGAAGFIGSHTCDQLLAAGHSVVGLDNFRTGRKSNLALAGKNPAFRFVEGDFTAGAALDELVAASKPEAIIHLAALVSVQESIQNPELNFRLNVVGTQIVAEAARRNGVGRVVFASSAAVYGDARQLPLSEKSETRPISPYGAAKLASEAILLGHAAAFGFTARCQRYFNVYGPRQDPKSPYSGVISIFADRLRTGGAPKIFGDGEQTRDFISVRDVARANVIAATAAGLASGVANICTGEATSLNRLIEVLRGQFAKAPAPVYAEAKASDIRHSLGLPAAAKNEFGFAANVSLQDGLAAMLAAPDQV
ncbi:MAG TPA: NAD-dependent epimerase/dehydratase family protein [Opitutaceae bacterium]|nr:NAD-dependent epimerase/dehydratase family protein [Opitutaceae bacterium]